MRAIAPETGFLLSDFLRSIFMCSGLLSGMLWHNLCVSITFFPRKDLDILLLLRESKYLLTPVPVILIPEKNVRIFAGSPIPVYKILFIYYENDTPLCLDYSYTPIDIYPGLTAEILGSRPILNVLQTDLQIPILKSNQRVTLIYTNEEESSLLQTAPGSPMMKYKGLVYDETGRLIHFFEDIMKIDDFAFIRNAEMEESWNN